MNTRLLTARPARGYDDRGTTPENWGIAMDTQEHSPGNAAPREILDRLEARYRELSEAAGARENPKVTLSGIFERWFKSSTATEPAPMFTDFIKSVQEILVELAQALGGADAGERSAAALAAAEIMLRVKPVNEKSQAEWYMVAAEYSFSELVPLTPTDTLKAIRDAYVRGTPKRMMYPRQRDLLKRMDASIR
jgi:hypothetical protein